MSIHSDQFECSYLYIKLHSYVQRICELDNIIIPHSSGDTRHEKIKANAEIALLLCKKVEINLILMNKVEKISYAFFEFIHNVGTSLGLLIHIR